MILPASRFELERDMLIPLADGLANALHGASGTTTRILREPQVGNVIPDLLGGSWPAKAKPISYVGSTLIDAHVRALIEQSGVASRQELLDRLYLSDGVAAASETRLQRHGVIRRVRAEQTATRSEIWMNSSEYVWESVPEASMRGLEIIAVEAKLSKWPVAVEQAQSYLTFADRAIVVLDGNRVRVSAPLLRAIEAAGVGLMLQHQRLLREIRPAPLHQSPITAERVMAMTKLVTTRGGRALRVLNRDAVGSSQQGA